MLKFRALTRNWLIKRIQANNLLYVLSLIIFILFLIQATHEKFKPWQRRGPQHVMHSKVDSYAKTSAKFSKQDSIFEERRRRLQEVCNGNENVFIGNNTEANIKGRMHIDSKHKIIYCAIEKTGSTFWKRTMQILIGIRNASNPFVIRGMEAHFNFNTLRKVSFDIVHVLLQKYTKFLFVREPYARLLSGYVDKLFSPNSFYWKYTGTYIVRYFRSLPSNHSIKCGHDVTFPEFIDYFIDSEEHNRFRNGHFTPSYDHCRPCQIQYDIIGKLESFKNDTIYILEKLGVDSLIHFSDFARESEIDALTDAADNVYAMRLAVTKCMTFTEALRRVWKKMQIRGLLSREIPFPYSDDSRAYIPYSTFSKTLLDAHARSGPRDKRIENRKLALIEAYRQIDYRQLLRLKRILEPDCKIFGYDPEPSIIFQQTRQPESFYFMFDY
ncbi:carbohydrate sulfotransferase 11-like [Octopus sinensis]|uniref:Carbohydrate sulfotransferase n=1 Tax=Octopus sinensis TaxID=2607531 RepID=A0A7E6FID5_9MOLL|nr:carbohydrate sulfotransferase 11-like [Octopus sinensis]